MSWTVRFFQTARGEFPVKEFMEDLDKPTGAKVVNLITLLTDYGHRLKPPYAKKLQGKLYELRVSGKVSVRIFYTAVKDEYFLLHGFKKKADKIPSRELKTALDRMKELI